MVITLLLVGGSGLYLLLTGQAAADNIEGTWVRSIDLTAQSRELSQDWLSQAVMGDSVAMGNYLTEPVVVNLVASFDRKGSYQMAIDEESYLAAQAMVHQALANALRDLIQARMDASGVDNSLTGLTIDEAAQEALGMSIEEYVASSDLGVFPTLESLQEQYENRGSYQMKKGVLTRNLKSSAQGMEQQMQESALVGKGYLVITGDINHPERAANYPIQFVSEE